MRVNELWFCGTSQSFVHQVQLIFLNCTWLEFELCIIPLKIIRPFKPLIFILYPVKCHKIISDLPLQLVLCMFSNRTMFSQKSSLTGRLCMPLTWTIFSHSSTLKIIYFFINVISQWFPQKRQNAQTMHVCGWTIASNFCLRHIIWLPELAVLICENYVH